MSTVEIEYCEACGFLERALATERVLLGELGADLDRAELVPGRRGVFEVRLDGSTLWDGDVHGTDPDQELILAAVRDGL